MDNTLMVATDLFPRSGLAVERAVRLAQHQGSDLWLLHVVSPSIWAMAQGRGCGTPAPKANERAVAARQQLLAMAKGIESHSALRVRTATPIGPTATRITEFAATHKPKLLIVGARGRNWVRDMILLGGTALKVVEKAEVPVLQVRRPATSDYSKVLVATDFSACSVRAARLAHKFFSSAKFILVHAYATQVEERIGYGSDLEVASSPKRKEELSRAHCAMEDFIAAIGIRQENLLGEQLVFGYPAQAILSRASKSEADLIVIGRHGGSSIGERLLGSVTQSVSYSAECDVLLAP